MFDLIIQVLVFGVFTAAIYSLQALGFNIVVGAMRILNLAHAELVVLGAYVSYWAWVFFGFNPIQSIPLSALLGVITGLISYDFLIKRFAYSADVALVATFALSLVLKEGMKIFWTANYRGIPWTLGSISFNDITVPITYIYTLIGSLVLILAVYIIMYKTYFGKACRAVAFDRETAAICGVNVKRILRYGFALSSCLAFVSGNLLTVYTSSGINPYMGQVIMVKCLIISTLGGLGNPWGALVGGLTIGMLEQIIPVVIMKYVPNIEPFMFTPFVYSLIFILILLLKPEGILGGGAQ
jgi:branched-chain amino acid transport system permease protein